MIDDDDDDDDDDDNDDDDAINIHQQPNIISYAAARQKRGGR